MNIYTIGFAGKKQDQFLEILDADGMRMVADIRLWRVARFVPWASGANLAAALGARYRAMPELAPTKELLAEYKNGAIDWTGYEKVFAGIMAARAPEKLFASETLDGTCFLCTEKLPAQCNRRLVAEYLAAHFPDVKIIHL
jgi:uncharacterized protein (DUF488 family)